MIDTELDGVVRVFVAVHVGLGRLRHRDDGIDQVAAIQGLVVQQPSGFFQEAPVPTEVAWGRWSGGAARDDGQLVAMPFAQGIARTKNFKF